jgi:hypothetical protein
MIIIIIQITLPRIAVMTPISPATTLTLAHARTPGLSEAHSGSAGFDSRQLLRGEREIIIRHGGEVYRLRHTRNDKLILTK